MYKTLSRQNRSKLDAHLAGQEGVLEIGRVAHTGGEQHHDRLLGTNRRGPPQRVEQPPRIGSNRPHMLLQEQAGKDAGHGPAVLHHVGHAGRHLQVVLEYPQEPCLVADDIDPCEVDPHAVRRLDTVRRPAKPGRGGEQRPRHHPVPDHLARPVDVGEKRLQRAYPLHDARFDQLPLGRRDQPRDQVEREDPLFAGMGEHDALVAEAAIPGLRPPRQVVAGERLQGVIQRPRVRVRQAIRPEHLIIGRAARVPVEEAAHKRIRTTGLLPRHSARRYSCETKLVHHAVMAAVASQVRTECEFRCAAEASIFALAVRCCRDGGSGPRR